MKNKFTLSGQDLLNCRQLLGSILKEYQQFNARAQQQSQQNQPGSKPTPAAATNEPNLPKQSPVTNKLPQRPSSRGFQPPTAPTTTHAPFQFGAASPDGRAHYVAPPAVTRDNLQIPPNKKIKTGQATSSPAVSSQTASPQTKVTSPELKKHEPKAAPKLPTFPCTAPDCEAGTPTFPTEALRKKHMEDFHVLPYQNAEQFLEQSLLEGFDEMTHVKAESATPMSREASVKQSAVPGVPAAPAAKADDKSTGVPKSTIGQPTAELQQPQTTDGLSGTIDPQNLLAPVIPDLSSLVGGVIHDISLYRSTTPPEDTPESSKDSGASEPNSDIPEAGSLDIEMSFQPFDDTMFESLNFGNDSWPTETITDDMLVNYDDPSFNKMQPLGDMSDLWGFNC